MQRSSMNAILFDEDEPSSKDHRESRTFVSSKDDANPKSHHLEIIEQEIVYLTDKIKSLETQADSLSQLRSENPSICRYSSTTIDVPNGHTGDVLMAVQKKIQIIVRETKKIVERMGEAFQKKLQSRANSKNQEPGLVKVKEQYAVALKRIEEVYKGHLERMQQENKQVQSQMIGKVNQIEQNLMGRMKEFEGKEKEYVDWIHHLERQLQDKQEKQEKHGQQEKQERQERQERQDKQNQQQRQEQLDRQDLQERQDRQDKQSKTEKQNVKKRQEQMERQNMMERQSNQERQDKSKSKRMIEITHAKRDGSENSSMITGDNNFDNMAPMKMGSQVNDSKIQRRHRIFDPVGKSPSVSPQNKVSPNPLVNTQPNPSNVFSSKVINPLVKSKKPDLQEYHPESSNPHFQVQKPGLVIERMTEPLKNNFTGEKDLSPWRAMDERSVDKSQGEATRRNQLIKDSNEDEFYKDVPRASQGWEKFQDYQENDDSSDSDDEEIMFYRNEDKRQPTAPLEKEPRWTNQEAENQSGKLQIQSQSGKRQTESQASRHQGESQASRHQGESQASRHQGESQGSKRQSSYYPQSQQSQQQAQVQSVFSPFDLN